MEHKLGAEAATKIEVLDGKVILSLGYDGKGADASVSISVDSDYLIDKLAGFIPGDSAMEQVALAAIKMALKSVKV
jgi:hypothetical protein